MVDITKPIYGDIWARAGEKLSPQPDKIATGWIQEMMPYQYENFLQNRTDIAISYLLQKGIPEWSAEQEYTANKSVVTYGGQLYMSTATTTNVLPTVAASWKRLTISLGVNGAVPISFGGTGATSASEARTNLGIGSSATADFPVSNGLIVKLSDNTLVSRTITGTADYITVTNGDGQSGNPVINIGANVAKTDTNTSWTSTGSIKLPAGSTSEQGTATPGKIRFNNETGEFHGAYADGWRVLAKPSTASETTIVDSGGYYTSGNVEGALQYVGETLSNAILSFPTYAAASAAAATLPDGQVISVESTFKTYTVYAGLLSDERPTNPAGVGTAGRSQQQRNTDIVSVRDFGAKGDGTGFDKDAFILAAVASKKALTAKYGGDIPRSAACEVFVPATGAKYILGSEVVPPGFDVVWYLDTGADFDDIDFLYGKVVRAGEKITANTYGLADTATTHSVGANSGHGMAGNFNLSTPSRLASYRSRDSVAQQHFASAPAPIARITGVTFTSTRVNFPEPLSETVIAKLRKGLVLDTTSVIASGGVTDGRDDLDNKWSGVVDGWDISGNWVSVTAWYRTGNTTTPETPTDNIVVINPVTLAMGAIDYASLGANSHGRWAIGGESDVVNNQGAVDPIPQDGSRFLNRRITIGRYVNAIGNYDKGTAGWVASGKWINGFQADAGSENAFAYYGTGRGLYLSQNPGTYIEVQNALGRMTYKQGPGGIDFFPAKGGGSAVGVSLRFGTGGSNVVDAAISVTGGSTVDAGGLVTFSAQQVHFNTGGSVTVSNTLRSNADNVSNLGLQSQRWKDLFLVNAPIVTCDEREKTTPKDIPNSMLDAWGEVNFFAWKWLSSVSEKGDAARIHYGPIAQHIRDAFIRHGLMTEESTDCLHAPLCYSEWSDAYENVMIEDTRVITYHCAETGKKKSFEEKYQRDTGERKLVMAAGNRWGIHADQCLFLEAAYQRRRADRIEARLSAIEAKL